VLESGQGQLKSSVLRALCPEDAWFSDDLPLNVDAKQIIERTAGKWIIEAADLSGMRKSQVEQLKAMLSRQVDGPVRMAYGRLPVERPRQFIIVGTTNDHHYLQDATGNRRFWPVRVQQFDVDAIRRERDQLWAEAAHREAAGESIRLDASLYTVATKQQNRRRIDDPWEEKLRVQFGGEDYCRVPPEDLWMTIGVPVERRDDKAQRRVSTVMQSLGFRRMSVRDQKGRTVWGWGRGAKEQGLVDEEHQNDDGV